MAEEVDKPSCYCGQKEFEVSTPSLSCNKCHGQFHPDCLKSGKPSPLIGDVFFDFTCTNCGESGQETLERLKMQWTQVVLLALYNLQLNGHIGKYGYFRWKEHICAFIDKHWLILFGSHRKKTNLWHGTVAGTLSSGCPHHFLSGAKELGETGWWRLAEMQPPHLKQGSSSGTKSGRRRMSQTPPISSDITSAIKVEGLRSRRGKTSIEAAMELKAKRETLLEAKDIRKAKSLPTNQGMLPLPSEVKQEPVDFSGKLLMIGNPTSLITSGSNIATLQGIQPLPQSSVNTIKHGSPAGNLQSFIINQASSVTSQTPTPSFQTILQNIKQEPTDHAYGCNASTPVPSVLASQPSSASLTQSSLSTLSSCGSTSGSFRPDADEDSQFSHGSSSRTDMWLTEQDLRAGQSLPSLLMSDDLDRDSDSDLEIDPGTITPPPGSPTNSPMQADSLSVQDILSSLDSSNAAMHSDFSASAPTSIETPDTSTPQLSFDIKTEVTEDADPSVVDSESEKDSDSDSSFSDKSEEIQQDKVKRKRKFKKLEEDVPDEDTATGQKVVPISLYEEHQLLRKLNAAADSRQLTPEINRLRRKLIVRQLKRERGLPIFDIDVEMNRLAKKCWGGDWETEDLKDFSHLGLPRSRIMPGDVRVLDRFQMTTTSSAKVVHQQMPSFLNRLVGTEDDQLQSIRSPYTARVLKPFIRRDYESRPLKMKLLQEIQAYHHRKDTTWKPSTPPSIDYCYVRPQHIPSVNTLCREFFWPGIDLSECLQYPDFSCVVLYRKFVIGFSFMVPDVHYNEAYISFIFTHPEWRRAGIAKFMLYHLIQTCMGKDIKLHVSATNSAMLLYQQFGFKPEEFILDFYDKYFPEDSRECKHAFCLRLRK